MVIETFSVSETASLQITRNDNSFGYSIMEGDKTVLSGVLSIQPREGVQSRKIAFMVIRYVRDFPGILLDSLDAEQYRWRAENMHYLDRVFNQGF